MATELDKLVDALDRFRASRDSEDAGEARRELWEQLTAIIDSRVTTALRAAGVAQRVGPEPVEQRRTRHGNDD